jgi:hypothetical protein
MQNHYIGGNAKSKKKPRSYWSTNPNGTVIIFVHGFGGQAVGTWMEFERLLPVHPKCANCDIVFYGYNSMQAQLQASAKLLFQKINRLCSDPLSVINPDLDPAAQRAQDFQVRRLLLVAHSLGAVISRRALLIAHDAGAGWTTNTSLALFGPAHLGARVDLLIASALSLFPFAGRAVLPLATYRYPPIKELEKISNILKSLKIDVQAALIKPGCDFLRARKVVFGEVDHVVTVEDFLEDTKFEIYEGKDHQTVCKPSQSFRKPADDVLELL